MYILIHEYYVLNPSFTNHNILFLADAYMFRTQFHAIMQVGEPSGIIKGKWLAAQSDDDIEFSHIPREVNFHCICLG